jgi:hypothetical protein
MNINRWSSPASPHTKFLAVAFVLLFGRIAVADAPSPVQLVSISALSSGATPQVVFTFDSDVHTDTLSTYTMIIITGGLETSQSPQLVTFDASLPTTVSVPLTFTSLASADAVKVSVTLSDNTHQSILKTPTYFLDLSFLKAVKGYQASILSLQQDKQGLQTQLMQCQTESANLINKLSPTSFDYVGTDLVGPTTVILHFRTDVGATIQVTDQTTSRMVPSVGLDHHVKFSSLAPSTPHTFKAVALNASGQPAFTKTVSVATPDLAAFSPIITKLTASGPTAVTATVDFNPTSALPASIKGYIILHYVQLVDPSTGIHGQTVNVGDGGLDDNGVPKGTPYSGAHDFTISGLTAGTTYLVTFTAYDDYGDVLNYPLPGMSVSTPKPLPPLAFSAPIVITMNTNTGLTVSWTANRKVSNSALKIKFSDGSFLPNVPLGTTGSQDSSVTVDVNGLSALLDKAAPKQSTGGGVPSATTPKPPEFDISMDDGTNSPDGKASIAFSVSFVISSTKQATSSVQTAANKVANSSQTGSKIKWSDVISTGLGILAKVI